VLSRVDEEVRLLHEHLGGLPRAVEADHVLRQIWIDDVHNSTAIEGNTMTRAQFEELVERGRASASLEESLEVEGYSGAADWIYRNAIEYTGVPVLVISEIHKLAMELPWKISPHRRRMYQGHGAKEGSGPVMFRSRFRLRFLRTSQTGANRRVDGTTFILSSTPPLITPGSSAFTPSSTETGGSVAFR
jgi:hypothetical protein